MKIKVKCTSCNGGKRKFCYPESRVEYNCPYCNGTGLKTEKVPHESHKMTRWRTDIRSPLGTPRFYRVRRCKVCHEEETRHPAGHFIEELEKPCSGKRNDE